MDIMGGDSYAVVFDSGKAKFQVGDDNDGREGWVTPFKRVFGGLG